MNDAFFLKNKNKLVWLLASEYGHGIDSGPNRLAVLEYSARIQYYYCFFPTSQYCLTKIVDTEWYIQVVCIVIGAFCYPV